MTLAVQRTLLVLYAILSVRALRVTLSLRLVHRAVAIAGVLLRPIHLLRLLRVMAGGLTGRLLVCDRGQLRCHHVLLAVLSWLRLLRCTILSTASGLLTLAFLFLLALGLFFLLLGFPLLPDLLELCSTQTLASTQTTRIVINAALQSQVTGPWH